MLELDRRSALTLAAIVPLAAALPAWSQEAASQGAMWDLSEIYPDVAAWDAARRGALAAVPGLAGYRGRLGESAAVLAEALVAQSDLTRTIARIYVYASLSGDEDLRVSPAQERLSQARDLFTALGEAISWTAPELLALGADKVEAFIAGSAVVSAMALVALAISPQPVRATAG